MKEPKYKAWIKKEKRMINVDRLDWGLDLHFCCTDKYVDKFNNVVFKGWKKEDVILRQSTGRKDKNDNEIFDGDIVVNASQGKFEVRWDEEDLSFRFIDTLMDSYKIEEIDDVFAVVGNIYENPKLFKKAKQEKKE